MKLKCPSRCQARSLLGHLAWGMVFTVPLLAGNPAQAEDNQRSAPPVRVGPIWNGQQHQPERAPTQQKLEQDGIARPAEESRSELRSLNELSRELLPSGAPLPAPALGSRAAARP